MKKALVVGGFAWLDSFMERSHSVGYHQAVHSCITSVKKIFKAGFLQVAEHLAIQWMALIICPIIKELQT